MFDLHKFKKNIAVITDRNESLTYDQLAEEVERFASILPHKGLVFTLCENLLGSFVGYVACMNMHIPQVLLDGSKDLELVVRLIDVYKPEYLWMPTERVPEIVKYQNTQVIYDYATYSLVCTGFASQFMNPDLQLCLTTSGSTDRKSVV